MHTLCTLNVPPCSLPGSALQHCYTCCSLPCSTLQHCCLFIVHAKRTPQWKPLTIVHTSLFVHNLLVVHRSALCFPKVSAFARTHPVPDSAPWIHPLGDAEHKITSFPIHVGRVYTICTLLLRKIPTMLKREKESNWKKGSKRGRLNEKLRPFLCEQPCCDRRKSVELSLAY